MPAIQDAIQALLQAISKPLELNDLGRLAQMHTYCLTIASGPEPAGGFARRMAALLEKLILNEAADPDAGLVLLPQSVHALTEHLSGRPVDLAERLAGLVAASGENGGAPAQTTAAPQATPAPTQPALAEPPPAVKATKPAQPAAAAPAAKSASSDEPEPYVSEPLVIDPQERDHLQGFIDESREHMDAIEAALLAVERSPFDTHVINELFRPFHTIKGIAGFLGLRDINRLTHEVETILDMGRKHELTITPSVIDVIFGAIDVLKCQVNELANYVVNPSGGSVPQPDIRDVMRQLRRTVRAATQAVLTDAPPGAATPVGERSRAAPASASVSGPATPAAAAPTNHAPAPAQVANTDASSAARGAPAAAEAASAPPRLAADVSIRVDTGKLDALVDAVGELVIAQTMVNQSSVVRADSKLARHVSQVTKIVRDVQETAMAMRMVPIGPTLLKMQRLVRDVSRKADKQVELEVSGEDTELDKNVIQAISDPLVHMIRNAVDHGIEPPEERARLGKPPVGSVKLLAYYQGDSIVIEIRDDGRGLDRERLRAKGIERGLVSPDQDLTDSQIYALIFEAGFSTAQVVTDISGRGVGMDVVRRNIEQLRGKVEIQTKLGQGSTFLIRLPLTLAIIDGILVRIGRERLIIPTIMIEQSLRPDANQITLVQGHGELIRVRGELITLVQLGQLFGLNDYIDPAQGLVVITQTEQQKIGLVVEELIGQQQVVIKSLGERFKPVRGISGAAILGDGRVGLILEPTRLLGLHNSTRSPTVPRRAPSAAPQQTSAAGSANSSAHADTSVSTPASTELADTPELASV